MVISRTNTIDSWSSWKAMSAWKSPTNTHEKSVWSNVRCSGEFCSIPSSISQPINAEALTVRIPR